LPERLMPFDPEHWLEAAAVCCIEIPEVDREALLRTALNRAYYAALLSFKHRIEAVQGPGAVPERRTHEAIYHAVGAAGYTFIDSYRTLRELRRKREAADYVLSGDPPIFREAHEAIQRSRWLIRTRIKALPDADFRRLDVRRT
jgi:hypothetical protein